MPSDFDRIEDERDLTAGLEYEDHVSGELESARRELVREIDTGAYELSDPKHPDHHDTFADYSDMA